MDKVLCKNCRLEFDRQALFCPNCGTAKHREQEGDPLLGTTIGDRYLLLEQIGQGASGSIYLGEHVTLRRKVVVKILHHELSKDDLAIERFRREATTVGELDNDHIVQIYDFGHIADGRLYLAMEHLEGKTLAAAIEEQGRLEIDQVVDLLIQLGEALIEAHAMGYVHRDLRPKNLFLAVRRTRANYLKLLDFGLAKLVEKEGEAASTSLGMTFGDPHYMSPEQARGDAVDRRADIYSMGCIAYEMLAGEPPFHGGKVFDVLTRQVEEKPRPLALWVPDIPAWLDRAVMRCLAKSPSERYVTVFRFVEALRQGTDSGVIMSDEVARRLPTREPVGVSEEAMEGDLKLGASPSSSQPEQDHLVGGERSGGGDRESEEIATAPKKPVVGSTTVLGVTPSGSTLEKAQVNVSPAVQVSGGEREPEREPLPVQSRGPTRAVQSGVDAKAESSSGLSAVWYAEGNTLEDGGELSSRQMAKLDKARGNSPSSTGLVTVSDEEYFDELPSNRRVRNILIVVAGVALLGAVAAKMLGAGGADRQKAESAGADAFDAAVLVVKPPTLLSASDAGTLVSQVEDAAALVEVASGGPSKNQDGLESPAAGRTENKTLEVAPHQEVAPPTDSHKPSPPPPSSPPPPPSSPSPSPPPPPHHHHHGSKPGPTSRPQVPKRPQEPDFGEPSIDSIDVTAPVQATATAQEKAEASALVGQGNSDLSAGDILGAASKFNKARVLDGRSAGAYAGLGAIALSQGAYRAALGHLQKASKMRPRSARILTLLGEAYLGAGDRSKAAAAFKRALQQRPDSVRAREGYNEAVGG